MASDIVISPVSGKLICRSVGVVISNPKKEILLLDHRKGVLGWAAPAGHLESGEFPLGCGIRELLEESGIRLDPNKAGLLLHADINNACARGAEAHEWYVYKAEADEDSLELKEPKKHRGIGWFNPAELRGQSLVKLEPVWFSILWRTCIIPFFPEYSDLESPD